MRVSPVVLMFPLELEWNHSIANVSIQLLYNYTPHSFSPLKFRTELCSCYNNIHSHRYSPVWPASAWFILHHWKANGFLWHHKSHLDISSVSLWSALCEFLRRVHAFMCKMNHPNINLRYTMVHNGSSNWTLSVYWQ